MFVSWYSPWAELWTSTPGLGAEHASPLRFRWSKNLGKQAALREIKIRNG